jgi:hypothetical protein
MNVDERHTLLQTLEAVPGRARRAAETSAGQPRPAGEWPAHIVVGHLLRVEAEVWQARFRRLAVEDNPFWEWWEPEQVAWVAEYGQQPLDRLLADFAAVRQDNLTYLRGLPADGWQRQGTHRTFGVLDVADLCREMLKHDENHVRQLEAYTDGAEKNR